MTIAVEEAAPPGPPGGTAPARRWRRKRLVGGAVILLAASVAVIRIAFAITAPHPSPPAPILVDNHPVDCALTVAAGPCWDNATGVPGWSEAQILAGQSPLTHTVGDLTITVDGTILSDRWIDGCIAVKAKNVTIQRVLVHTEDRCRGGDNRTAGSGIDTGNNVSMVNGLKIVDSEIDGMNGQLDRPGIAGVGFSCTRCDVHGFAKNLWPTDTATITDSYIHDNAIVGTTHLDGVMLDGGYNITVNHSWIKMVGHYVTAAIGILADWSGNGITITANYLEGADGADIQCGGTVITGLTITDNALSPINGWGGKVFAVHFSAASGNVWRNNYNSETTAQISPPAP